MDCSEVSDSRSASMLTAAAQNRYGQNPDRLPLIRLSIFVVSTLLMGVMGEDRTKPSLNKAKSDTVWPTISDEVHRWPRLLSKKNVKQRFYCFKNQQQGYNG